MAEKYYTQRGFAAAAGISTATVVKMIKSGRLQKAEGGRIPASELRKFLIDVMRKHSDNGTLMLCVGKSDEEIAEMKASVEKDCLAKGQAVHYFDDFNDIIRTAADYTPSEASAKFNTVKYNKQVLDTFIRKYRSSAEGYFSSLVSSNRFPAFCSLPASVAYDLVFYGKAEGDLDSVADCLPVIQREMNDIFRMIVEELCLTGDDNHPLFQRKDLDADFYNKSGAVYDLFVGENPVVLKQCGRIAESLAQSVRGSHLKDSIGRLLDDVFYTICNAGDDSGYLELISSGVYGRIIVNAGGCPIPAELEIALRFAACSNHCSVEVI